MTSCMLRLIINWYRVGVKKRLCRLQNLRCDRSEPARATARRARSPAVHGLLLFCVRMVLLYTGVVVGWAARAQLDSYFSLDCFIIAQSRVFSGTPPLLIPAGAAPTTPPPVLTEAVLPTTAPPVAQLSPADPAPVPAPSQPGPSATMAAPVPAVTTNDDDDDNDVFASTTDDAADLPHISEREGRMVPFSVCFG